MLGFCCWGLAPRTEYRSLAQDSKMSQNTWMSTVTLKIDPKTTELAAQADRVGTTYPHCAPKIMVAMMITSTKEKKRQKNVAEHVRRNGGV